jgi:hypothetical protein
MFAPQAPKMRGGLVPLSHTTAAAPAAYAPGPLTSVLTVTDPREACEAKEPPDMLGRFGEPADQVSHRARVG